MRKKLFDPSKNKTPMRVAGFMSGSGTNIKKILENQKNLKKAFGNCPYEVAFLFSDRKDLNRCKIKEIAMENNLPYEINDIWDYYTSRGHDTKKDLNLRADYDLENVDHLKEHDIDAIALAGYMSIVTERIFKLYPTINVHPADLTKMKNGKRKFIGDNAVRDAILAGETHIASSTILVNEQIDGGPLLLVSKPITVKIPFEITIEFLKKTENKTILNEITERNQDELKREGDWKIFPKTLEYLGNGSIEVDDEGKVFINNLPAPIRLQY
ncbi:MAG: formyl transferase [Candidatus Lokiarchaeota archaeon]|nr:formyl transferase [Candidatus Lokiarchaeota archaeon]